MLFSLTRLFEFADPDNTISIFPLANSLCIFGNQQLKKKTQPTIVIAPYVRIRGHVGGTGLWPPVFTGGETEA